MGARTWRTRLHPSRCYSTIRKTHQGDWSHQVPFLTCTPDTPLSVSCRILRGNLAPGGAVAKITGKEGLGFTGKAICFDSEDEMVKAVESGSIKKGEKSVVVMRYLGPKGGPGQSLDCFFRERVLTNGR